MAAMAAEETSSLRPREQTAAISQVSSNRLALATSRPDAMHCAVSATVLCLPQIHALEA